MTNNKEIIFTEKTPMSTLDIGDITLSFDGDIRDFKEHFPLVKYIETEGAGI